MHSSNMPGKRSDRRPGYGFSHSLPFGSTASAQGDRGSTVSSASAAAIAARSSSDGSGTRPLLRCLLAVVPLAVLAGSASAAAPKASWAAPQIRVVTAAGLLGAADAASFRADDPLTAQSLEDLVFDLTPLLAPAEPEPDPLPEDPTATEPAATTEIAAGAAK